MNAKPKTVRVRFPVTIIFPPEYVGTSSANMVLGKMPNGATLVAQVHALHTRCRYPRTACRCGAQTLYTLWHAGLLFRDGVPEKRRKGR